MINRVVLGGRIVEGPRREGSGGREQVALEIEVGHPRRGGGVETCRVKALARGERRVEHMCRYLEPQRNVLLEGHLVEDEDELVLLIERWHFVEREIEPKDLAQEAYASPGPAAAA